jgi:CRP-like cAMP-binding protein
MHTDRWLTLAAGYSVEFDALGVALAVHQAAEPKEPLTNAADLQLRMGLNAEHLRGASSAWTGCSQSCGGCSSCNRPCCIAPLIDNAMFDTEQGGSDYTSRATVAGVSHEEDGPVSGHHEPQKNHLLNGLSPAARERLYPHLELVEMLLGRVLYESGDTLLHVYFPTDSIVSLLYVMEDGASAEIAVVGNEGLIGVALFMGGETTTSRAIVQSGGYAYRLLGQRLKDEFHRNGEMQILVLRYTQALITQMAQTAVCNRHHSVVQQLCRWLLLSLDRLPSNELTMTQELIANMLGVRREGVTDAARKLQKLNVIRYRRGQIAVLDRPKLEQLSCECYAVVKRETDRLLPIHL